MTDLRLQNTEPVGARLSDPFCERRVVLDTGSGRRSSTSRYHRPLVHALVASLSVLAASSSMADPITAWHYAANGNFANGAYDPGALGFNLADVESRSQLDALPRGVKALVYLGLTNGADASFQAIVNAYKGNPNLFGFYLADEPNAGLEANLKAEADWIHANVPGAKTFMVEQNVSSLANPVYVYTPANTNIDLFGIDGYPVRTDVPGGLDYSIIPRDVSAAEAAGVPQQDIVPVYQAFGGGGYLPFIAPTSSQEQQILSIWGPLVPNPAFDYAYSWGAQAGDTAISNDPGLQAVFAAHNGIGPPVPEISTWAMMAIGFAGLGFIAYRKPRSARPRFAVDRQRHTPSTSEETWGRH